MKMTRSDFTKTVALVVVSVVFVGLASWSHEPRYRGRTLTSWLQQCDETPLMETQRLAEAQDAVRAIGASKALPILLRMVEAEDGPVRSWFIRMQEKWNIRFLKLREASLTQQLGIAGFEALETNGTPAIGELTRLLGGTISRHPGGA